MRRSLFFIPLIFGSLVLNGCGGRGMQIFFDNTPTAPAPTEVAFVTPTTAAVAAIATPTPIVVTATPPPVVPPTETPDSKVGGHVRSTPPPAVDSPPSPTPTPTIPGLWLLDDFENPANDGKFDEGLWTYYPGGPTTVEQNNGFLTLSRQSIEGGGDSEGLEYGPLKMEEIDFVEAKLMLDSNIQGSRANINIGLWNVNSGWWFSCGIGGTPQESDGSANCGNDNYALNEVKVQYNSWHTVRFEVNRDTAVLSLFIDDQSIGTYTPPDPEAFKQTQVNFYLQVWSDGGLATGYIDDVRVGKAQAGVSAVDPATVYDDFNNPAFDGAFDKERWTLKTYATGSAIVEQKEGVLKLSHESLEQGGSSGLSHSPFKIDELGFVEAKLMLDKNNIKANTGTITLGIEFGSWWLHCDIAGSKESNEAWASCHSNDGYAVQADPVPYNEWQTLRFEINPDNAAISFFANGVQIDSDYIPSNSEDFKKADLNLDLFVWSKDGGLITGYADDVRIGRLGQ